MECKVFYESWQMDCCGEPFAIGDTVNWIVCEYKELGENQTVDLGKIDYFFEKHLFDRGPYYKLEGKIKGILILYEKFGPSKIAPFCNVPVSGTLRDATRVERLEEEYMGMKATGYIVILTNIKMGDLDNASMKARTNRKNL